MKTIKYIVVYSSYDKMEKYYDTFDTRYKLKYGDSGAIFIKEAKKYKYKTFIPYTNIKRIEEKI